jgi:hypothetical protein
MPAGQGAPVGSKGGTDNVKRTALDKALRAMFGRLRARPAPDRLISVVDELEEAEAPPRKTSRRG